MALTLLLSGLLLPGQLLEVGRAHLGLVVLAPLASGMIAVLALVRLPVLVVCLFVEVFDESSEAGEAVVLVCLDGGLDGAALAAQRVLGGLLGGREGRGGEGEQGLAGVGFDGDDVVDGIDNSVHCDLAVLDDGLLGGLLAVILARRES